MLYSRVQLVNEAPSRSMNAILQDTYDVQDEEEQSNDASFENFYDAPAESTAVLPEVRIDMEPSGRLIDAIESLREVILENTNAHAKSRRRGRTQPSGGYKQNGSALSLKDERLKIRKEKVGQSLILCFDTLFWRPAHYTRTVCLWVLPARLTVPLFHGDNIKAGIWGFLCGFFLMSIHCMYEY